MQAAVKSPQLHWSQGEEEDREWEPGDGEQHGKILTMPSSAVLKIKATVAVRLLLYCTSPATVLQSGLYFDLFRRARTCGLICFCASPCLTLSAELFIATVFHARSEAGFISCGPLINLPLYGGVL